MPFAQLGDAQLNRTGSCLPIAVAIAVALHQPGRALLAMAGAGQRPDLDLHQPLGGKGDHLAQGIGVGVFSTSERRFIISSVIGGILGQELDLATRP
jgi:hypothetical protein